MQDAQETLKRTAVDFLEAAETVAGRAAEGPADPLDAVATDLFELGDLEPAIDRRDLAALRQRLHRSRLLPDTVLELVALARQVAETLTGV